MDYRKKAGKNMSDFSEVERKQKKFQKGSNFFTRSDDNYNVKRLLEGKPKTN